jgi:hypothetical protein
VLISGVRCQLACQRRDRPAPRAIPGLTSAREGGEGHRPRGEGPPGREGTPRPQAADSPARVARLAARGPGCGRDPGAPAGSPAPCARPPRGFRHGPRAPARPPRWQGAGTPAPTESASRVYTQRELSGIRALEVGQLVRNSVARVHVGRAFWHPGAGGGAARRKLRPMCTRGMRLLTYDRPAVAFPQLKGNRNPDFARNPTSCVHTGWGFWPGRALEVGWHLGSCQPP